MGIKMLAARSGETVKLKSIVILVTHCCSPCFSRNIYLPLSHTVTLLVFHAIYISLSHGIALLVCEQEGAAIYRILPFYAFSSNRN